MGDRTGPRSAWVLAWFLSAISSLVVLHLVEPELTLSWSFAGLRAAWGTVLPALVAGALVFAVVLLCWRAEIGDRVPRRPSVSAIMIWGLLLWLILLLVGFRWPAPDVCPDAAYLPFQLQVHGRGNPRWLLAVPLLQVLFAPFDGRLDPDLFLRAVNALFSTMSVLLTAGIALRLGRSLREVVAIVVLVWTGLGTLQLAFGYVDIYPLVQLLVALYLWTAIRYLDGDGSVFWPLVVAVARPCFYIGLILLGPSVLVLLFSTWQRRDLNAVSLALCVALTLAGLATMPMFGTVFAVPAWLHRLSNVGVYGLNPGRQTLPVSYMFSMRHAGEVISSLVLLDGVALVLVAALPIRTRVGMLLLLILLARLAFVIAMDPVWGPYSDWDLFSYPTFPLGVGAGLAFATWSRGRSRMAGVVLGPALAASTVHLFARLNTLHLDFERHNTASPFHIPNLAPSVFKPSVRRSVP